MFKVTKTTLLALFVVVFVGACGAQQGGQEGEDGSSLRVVATFSVLGDIVKNVSGDNVDLTTMVGPTEDTHNFQAIPSDSRALTEADLIFENGLEFETWLDDLYESSGSEARRVVVSKGIEPIEAGEHREEGTHEEHEEDNHAHDHGGFDPHVWQDPNNTIVMVENIRDALIEADPDNEDAYRQNAEEYIRQLEDLDVEIRRRVESIPEENRKLVTGHRVFTYFAEEYEFEIPGTAISSLTTEASDPSAGQIAELSDRIEEENVPAIFPEMFTTDEQVMERLANEAGVELAPPLYTGALDEEGNEGDTYLDMMRYNARTIADALGG